MNMLSYCRPRLLENRHNPVPLHMLNKARVHACDSLARLNDFSGLHLPKGLHTHAEIIRDSRSVELLVKQVKDKNAILRNSARVHTLKHFCSRRTSCSHSQSLTRRNTVLHLAWIFKPVLVKLLDSVHSHHAAIENQVKHFVLGDIEHGRCIHECFSPD